MAEPLEKRPELATRIASLLADIPNALETELQFELDMFVSRLELLVLRGQKGEADLASDRRRISENIFEYLRDDLIYFLQKSIAQGGVSDKVSDRGQLRRAFLSTLREFRADTSISQRTDFSRLSIPEKWYRHLSETSLLSEEKIIHFLDIYRHQIYSLLSDVALDHSDLRGLIRRLAGDSAGEVTEDSPGSDSRRQRLSFEEIYRAEVILRDEIQFTLLREYARGRRLEYLIGKEFITKITDHFIQILHQEFESRLAESLSEHKRLVQDMVAEKGTLDQELRAASHQHSRLLQSYLPPADPRIAFDVLYQPILQLGGDFYRIFVIDAQRYGIFLLDIAGHGLGAAMYINTVANAFEDMQKYRERPGRFMRHMNEALYGRLGDNFVTAIYLIVNLKKNRLEYASAGHTPGILFSLSLQNSRARFLKPNGRVMGVFKKVDYVTAEWNLQGDSRVILYTDGISETFNSSGEIFSERRLVQSARITRGQNQKEAARSIEADLAAFAGSNRPDDDRTLIQVDLFPDRR